MSNNIRVLLAEDDDLNRDSMQLILESFGFDVFVAIDGQQAIDYVREMDIDIVLIDVSMPIINGIDATREIRNALKSDVPIIGITGGIDDPVYHEAGMNSVMYKPIDLDELHDAIIAHVNRS